MDVEETIHFLLEQQAAFAAHLQRVGERLEQVSERLEQVAENQWKMSQVQSRQQEMISQLTVIAGRLADAQQQADRRITELAEAQRHTEENLNALIKIVDEWIRRDGGRPA